ncbi:MAG TPA: cobalt-precorrin 5A hydrolase [Candidatus Methanoculleus thermohydrogenotrophicum]|jgi:cobalt-precorrin 5A hydrolase|nr:cobalt-precorrin 5A hydrolase [Candidatus Methanoculleus thermohydrogenotrophicum]NLM81060.1 cobalt-precorrin 5A hydrolase [Candidatus Methanoculleus thermohydrogenotrophicum]HOB18417.1 cobalt-precorrin 5A hydrolase [Candidatus Methanoculleus thermohydrogenotrophicum]HPZ38346.1 cobalt-precorrin 5A hydrolase [Candidatus Methanoculleus thermohydrogenotrophicum]HQC91714.1 cobalt-precorrin 5A hydrolase [Candidatus Methanoculleus thermohydrogenotrophicum]
MTRTAVVALDRFLPDARRIADALGAEVIPYSPDAFQIAFANYRRVVALMSAGIAVRGIAPLLVDKWRDPAVVVVSPDLSHAVPIVGGHHGGNDLARDLAALGIEPVITTATETRGLESVEGIAARRGCDIVNRDSTRVVNTAILDAEVPLYAIAGPGIVVAGPGVSILLRKGDYTVGVGCRKGVSAAEVTAAIEQGLHEAGITPDEVLVYATTAKKRREAGLIQAIADLGSNLVFLDNDTINAWEVKTPSRASMIGLAGVAEPAALAVSKRKELVLAKQAYGSVTVAIAQ